MSAITALACPTCLDGTLTEHLDLTGPVLVCNYCTVELDGLTLTPIV